MPSMRRLGIGSHPDPRCPVHLSTRASGLDSPPVFTLSLNLDLNLPGTRCLTTVQPTS